MMKFSFTIILVESNYMNAHSRTKSCDFFVTVEMDGGSESQFIFDQNQIDFKW